MSSKRPLLFTLFGSLFLLAGIITCLSILAGWQLSTPLAWQHWAYAALNFLFAYGFFTMQAWLLPLFGVLVGANTLLTAVRWFTQGLSTKSLLLYTVIILGGAAILWGLNTHKHKMRANKQSRAAGIICAAMLLAVFGYTISVYAA